MIILLLFYYDMILYKHLWFILNYKCINVKDTPLLNLATYNLSYWHAFPHGTCNNYA